MDSFPDGNQTAGALWHRAALLLHEQLSEAAWRTWFLGVEPIALDDGALTLGVPSSVALERIRSSYGPLLAQAVRDTAGLDIEVHYVVAVGERLQDDLSPPASASDASDRSAPTAAAEPVPWAPSRRPSAETGMDLLDRYTFDQFVIGASNRFAHAAALQVAEAPARSYNPLFIYGPAGLGKTHLLHAIGHHVIALFPGKRVRYVLTETMMNEFVDAIRNNTMQGFKRRYREVDVLLLDDIQFLERSEQLREEFFHTFNALHAQNSQIVLSSDRAPKSIAVEDRLRSRFEWGLITDVQPPEFETRLAILRKKADSEHLQGVPDDVLAFIAAHVSDNVRELEGALIRVTAYSSLNRQPLSEDVARQVLADLLPAAGPRIITPQLILDETAKMFGWTVEDLCGKSRRRPLTTARQIGMYVFRELTDFSYPRIAEEFGGRDHTTVMYAVEKIKTLMAERRQVFDQVNELITNVKHAAGEPGGRHTGG